MKVFFCCGVCPNVLLFKRPDSVGFKRLIDTFNSSEEREREGGEKKNKYILTLEILGSLYEFMHLSCVAGISQFPLNCLSFLWSFCSAESVYAAPKGNLITSRSVNELQLR